MKRKNYKRKLFSYIVIWSVFISSLLLYSPETHVFSESGIPEITMISPQGGSEFTVSTVEFTGKISDDNTPSDKLSLKVFEKLNSSQQPIDITDDGKRMITNMGEYAQFSFLKEFSEGDHTLIFQALDETGNITELTQNFTVKSSLITDRVAFGIQGLNSDLLSASNNTTAPQDTADTTDTTANTGTRPFVYDISLVPPEGNDPGKVLPADDMTQVPIGYQIRIVIRTAGTLSTEKPIITVVPKVGDIEGTPSGTAQVKDGLKEYVFTFKPEKLEKNTTYHVYIDSNISNDAKKNIVPRFFKFTTISTYEEYQYESNGRPKDYIHGDFSGVTNSCAYCHSTHNGKSPTLEGGKYANLKNNLCMACHDGTNGTGTPIPDKYSDSKHTHAEGKILDTETCTSCHNPHEGWSKENPNRLKGASVTDYSGTHFQTYSYKKVGSYSSNVSGSGQVKSDDFSLCLRCHNGTNGVSNIAQYYKDDAFTDPSKSGHIITASVDSGSKLNGRLPCSECHETHGSNNIMMLKENIGNLKPDDKDKYTTQFDTWTASDERAFCMKCHDGTKVIYGITGTFPAQKANGELINGHQNEDDQACSSCHGGDKNLVIEAAHAPSPGK